MSESRAFYLLTPELETAVDIAKILQRPLFLTGEPGVGKSSLARHLAAKWEIPYRDFIVKSDTRSSDLFYEFDAVGRFALTNESGAATDAAQFVRFNALGWALLRTYPQKEWEELSQRVDLSGAAEDQPLGHDGNPHSVVLIDEIDKAPRDVPNDLLDEFDHFRFAVRELGYQARRAEKSCTEKSLPWQFTANKDERNERGEPIKPLVIITSNDERGLPDAFMRRCIFHHIAVPPFRVNQPEAEVTLDDILAIYIDQRWFKDHHLKSPFSTLFTRLHDQLPLKKRPTLAELLWFLQALGVPDAKQHSESHLAESARSILLKNKDDQETGKDAINAFVDEMLGRASPGSDA